MRPFAGHIVYLDESGTTVPGNARDTYPVFVLAAVCVAKPAYARQIVPDLQELKFRHFGHDQIILHERDIRRTTGPFATLRSSKDARNAFLDDINRFVANAPMQIIAGIIDHRHEHNNLTSLETYELALGIVIAELREHLAEFARPGDLVHLIAESRGASEDLALELAFNRIISGVRIGDYMTGDPEARFRWAIVFADKRSNSAGLQVADLVARPIGLDYLNPTQPNRAAEIINAKEPRIIAWP